MASTSTLSPDEAALAARIGAALPKKDGLFAGKRWRVSPRPLALSPTLVEQIKHLGHHLLLFQKAADLLYRRSVKGTAPRWVAELLDAGKPQAVVDLGRHNAFLDQIPRVIRPDLILTESGVSVVEIDSLPGGIGLTAWLNKAYSDIGMSPIGGTNGMLDGFRSIMPGGAIYVSEEASDYRPEMAWLADILRPDLPATNGLVVLDEKSRIPDAGHFYRFFELFDLPNIPQAADVWNGALAGKLSITPPPKAFLEEKLWLALLWLRPLREYWERELGRRHFERLLQSVPRSWILDPAPLPYHAELPGLGISDFRELAALSQKERRFALKISGFSPKAWGSRGVVIGHDHSREDWATAIDIALNDFSTNPWILQEFQNAAIVEHPYLDEESGGLIMMKGRVRLCPYFFVEAGRAELRGVLATIVPADKKLLHGMSEAILVPCVIDETSMRPDDVSTDTHTPKS